MKRHALILLTLLFQYASAQVKSNWNVEKPGGPSKTVSITTDEGTWMNLDVSPDGKEIVFDLLGDIYKMPVSGGRATLLSGGNAFDVQPRFSPNGKQISYTSDREGGDNIWVMNSNGSNKRAVSKETFRLLNNAVWTPDNQFLIGRKHFTNTRSLGAGEMWMYHISGGEGVQLTKRKNDQQDAGEPEVSHDGKYVYYSEDVSPGPYFQYNKDPNGEIYAIKRLNRETGEIEKVTGGPGGAVRPRVSPDGKLLAFVRRVRLKSVLFLHDLSTGEEWPVYDDLSRDQQETWAIFGVYPNFAFTPDSKNIIFYAKGKIRNLDILSQTVNVIPFEVTSTQLVAEALHFEHQVFNEEFDARMIRQLATSPDGKMIAFNSGGFVYLKELPNGQPKRISKGTEFEFDPNFSPDGKSLVYVAWTDEYKASIKKLDLRTLDSQPLTTEKGFYYTPRYSNKGDKIIYAKGGGNSMLGYTHGKNAGIYIISANGGTPQMVVAKGVDPYFNGNDSRVFFQSTHDGKKAFMSVDLAGGSERVHYHSKYASQFAPSPDGKWLAFTELFNAYITPLLNTANGIELSATNKSLPVTKVTRDAGIYLHWSHDSKNLNWTLGSQYFSRQVKNTFSFAEGAPNNLPPIDTSGVEIGLKIKSDVPEGKIALTNARIITMKGKEVIQNGTIVIEGNRITAVGPADQVKVPDDAKVISADNQTIMPGLVDVHAHLPTSPDGISPQQDWGYYANLAYGVTTAHDPSSNTEMVLSQAEMVKAGTIKGPRIYSTGTILYGADGDFKAVINGADDARSHLRRLKMSGAFSVKSYNQPRREQRQQIIQAARELKMEVFPEGGSTFFTNMSMILDGHSGIEHNIPVIPVYKDVKSLWNASKTAYTPTLIVSYGSQSGENFWYDRTNVWENDKLLSFTPRGIIDSRSRRRMTSEFGDYGHIDVSKAVKYIADGGTKINMGSHGQIQGLGAHWELWMLAQGGMNSHDILRAGTINGASYLGMSKEIGSLEPGKLADMIVLDANPLDDIRNTDKIRFVMVNGRLFDAQTMNEEGNHPMQHSKFWWQQLKGDTMGPEGTSDTFIFTHPKCD